MAGCTELARSLYHTWAENITKNAKEVAKLYHEQAILLPTVRGNFLNNPQDIEHYFELFCGLNPHATLVEGQYKGFKHGNVVIFTGHYDFTFASQEDTSGRFSFVFQASDEKALDKPKLGENFYILHHHSSVLPTELL